MEFGTTIPLYFLTMCCFITVPIAGTGLLVFIRFSLEDKQLFRYIITTVLAFGGLALIFPFIQLVWSLPLLSRAACCDKAFEFTPEMVQDLLSIMLPYAAGLTITGIWLGFLVAFLIVLPITLGVRYFRKKTGLAKPPGPSTF